jgi:hypothetical protein
MELLLAGVVPAQAARAPGAGQAALLAQHAEQVLGVVGLRHQLQPFAESGCPRRPRLRLR